MLHATMTTPVQRFAVWLLAQPYRSMLLMAGFGALPLLGLLPFLSVVSGGIAALLVLAVGLRRALVTSIGAAGLLAVIAYVANAGWAMIAGSNLLIWLVIIALAGMVAKTGSLRFGLQILVLLSMVDAAAWAIAIPDPAVFWGSDLAASAALLGRFDEQQLEVVRRMAVFMPAVIACSLFLMVFAGLMLGRWWHCTLRQPGSFATEARALSMGKVVALLAVLVAIAAALTGHVLAINLLLVLVFGFVIHALSVIHALIAIAGLPMGFLVVVYATLIFLLALAGPFFAVFGFLDVWLDFRARAMSRGNQ